MSTTNDPESDRTDANGKPGRAADDLFQILADQIATGALSQGAPLPPEREIVEEYGVSRTVVREAVMALAANGLVDARPRHRPVVRRPSYDTALDTVGTLVVQLLRQPGGVKNLFDTRIMIEASLVREAALKADKTDIAALKAALDKNGQAIDDSALFYQTDTDFHRILYDIPKNPVLPAIHRAYTTWLAPQWSKMPRAPRRNADNHQAHTAIFQSILMRDPDAAEAALRVHLNNAWIQVCETFGDV